MKTELQPAAAIAMRPNGHAMTDEDLLRLTGSRLRTVPWSEMVAGPVEPISYHWSGWVPLATVAVLTGAGESLKSWLALLLAVFTAAGRAPLVAEETEETRLKAGPVLYLTAENALHEEQRRCGMLKAGFGLPDDLPITFVPAEGLSLGSEEDYKEIVGLVERLRPVAIFLDSAIALSGLADENDNAKVRAFLRARVLPLARTHRATVYLVGHSPKPSTQPGARFTDEHVARGASDWRNACDVMLYLRRDPSLGPAAVVLRHAKCRIGPRHAPMWFALEEPEPEQAIRLVFGGSYSEDTGQASGALVAAINAAIEALKAQPAGVYLKALDSIATAKATRRRALDVIRGKAAWPHGPYRGQKRAIVTEDSHGRERFLTFVAASWPSDEDSDDA